MNRRALTPRETADLKSATRRLTQLRAERRTASNARRRELDVEIAQLNAKCEAIVAAV
jgi:hypothetical protein